MTYDLVVFDIDGVLLDTGPSYLAGIDLVARVILRELTESDWDIEFVTPEMIEACKAEKGFNNDWELCLAWVMAGIWFSVKHKEIDPDVLVDLPVIWAIYGEGAEGVDQWVAIHGVLLPDPNDLRSKVVKEFQCMYAGTECEAIYGFESSYDEGLYKRETVLVGDGLLDQLQKKVPLSILTGRNGEETNLVLDRISWPGEKELIIADTEPRFRKPSPDGLLELQKKTGAQNVLFLGDSYDDFYCFKQAQEINTVCRWTFLSVGATPTIQTRLKNEKHKQFFANADEAIDIILKDLK